jgi:hypothetical protein
LHQDLTLYPGVQRIQIYRCGMGVTVKVDHPPFPFQLRSVAVAFARTPMSRFAAENGSHGRRLVTPRTLDELSGSVNGCDPTQPGAMVRTWPWLAGLLEARADV